MHLIDYLMLVWVFCAIALLFSFQWSDHYFICWPSFQYYEKMITIIASSALHVTLTGPWRTGWHAAVLSLTVISPRGWWWADKQFTRAKNEAEDWWDKTLHGVTYSEKEADRETGERWKDAGDCNWLIKVTGGLNAGDSWQCASEVVQHLACEGNIFPFIKE